MGLPWVRLDSQFASNPKILSLIAEKKYRAAFVWTAALAYAGAHGTDGFLPANCLPFIHATKADAKALVEARLWLECIGGWEVNSWSEFQPSNAETEERKKKAKEAAMKRWHGDAS